MSDKTLRIGHSPDPDDAFMCFALAEGAVRIRDFAIEQVQEDIESLNQRALKADLEVTAISAHAYLSLSDKYWILATGASMGEGYGPVLVSKREAPATDFRGRRIAIPGDLTTAALLTKIYVGDFEPVVIPFDRIFDAVRNDEVDAGVVIHEGQLTYEKEGFQKIMDFGARWEQETDLPLPLGLDVVRKDLGRDLAEEINRAMRASIDWAYEHEEEALSYALKFGRGLERDLGRRFVNMYVSDVTKDMGPRGEKALQVLFDKAVKAGVASQPVPVDIVR